MKNRMKNEMKKALSLLLVMILCVISLCSCHGKTVENAGIETGDDLPQFVMPDSFDSARDYEITFWAKNDNNKQQINIYRKTVEDFQKIYPNITVNLKLYSDYKDIYSDVITNIPTHSTPNVCITYPDHIATYLTGTNLVVPLDELMVDPDYGLGGKEVLFDAPTKDEIVSQFLSECVIDGKYYCLPYMRSTEACYVNKTFVEKLGFTLPETLTWDFVFEVSKKATEKNADGTYKVNGQDVMLPFIYKSTDNMMIQMTKQFGIGYSTDDGEILLFNDQTRSLLLSLAEATENGSFSTFKFSGYPGNYINAGQCIFAIDSTAGATWMGTNAPNVDIPKEDMTDFEMVVMSIPQYDISHPQMISQGPSVCVFNKEDTGEVMASWLFVQYLLTNGVQIDYASTEGYVPVTTKAQNSAEYLDYLSRSGEDNELYYSIKLDASRLLLDNLDNTFITPVFNGSASLRSASGALIENVVKNVKRKKTVDDAFITQTYASTISQYKLEQKKELGALPTEAIVLLAALAVIWVGIVIFALSKKIRQKKP